MPNSPESAEDRLIARYFRPLAKHPGALGLVDDAAVITPPPGCDVVLKTDGVIVGVHAFPDDRPENIGRKALRMNLSDLAAKGATPIGFLIVGRVAGGQSTKPGSRLLPAALARTPSATTVRCSAATPIARPVRRRFRLRLSVPYRTAKWCGDRPPSRATRIVVTGTIGDAALGVLLRRDENLAKRWRLSEAMSAHLKQRYLLPEPRNVLANAVLQNASAAMDVSDGLAGDLAKLCRASGVAAEIDVARVPLSDAVARRDCCRSCDDRNGAQRRR